MIGGSWEEDRSLLVRVGGVNSTDTSEPNRYVFGFAACWFFVAEWPTKHT